MYTKQVKPGSQVVKSLARMTEAHYNLAMSDTNVVALIQCDCITSHENRELTVVVRSVFHSVGTLFHTLHFRHSVPLWVVG